jgi:hypothetical protein
MVKLINGRGQLGEKLQRLKNDNSELNISIYHTWKVPYISESITPDEVTQKNEYLKLVEFSKNNPNTKIIFISTNSVRSNHYSHYKELAEAYLLLNHEKCVILKFPPLIGKGILPKLKSGELKAFGIMELMTLDKTVEIIESYISYEGSKRVFTINGEKIEAATILEILKLQ